MTHTLFLFAVDVVPHSYKIRGPNGIIEECTTDIIDCSLFDNTTISVWHGAPGDLHVAYFDFINNSLVAQIEVTFQQNSGLPEPELFTFDKTVINEDYAIVGNNRKDTDYVTVSFLLINPRYSRRFSMFLTMSQDTTTLDIRRIRLCNSSTGI